MRHLGILFISVVFGVITPLTVTAGPGNGAGQLASSVGCQPDGSPKDDDIICTGITPVAVEAGKGNDQVDIQTGATVSTAATDPQPQSTAVDGGEDNDTITNNGEVSVDIFSLGNNLKNIPALGTQNVNNSNANDDVKAAQAIGIAGGEGMDTITNIGVIDVNTLINTASIGLAGPPPGPAPKTRSSLAVGESVGIDGGSEDDSILNSGEINVSATSLVEIGDVSGTDSGSFDANSPKNEDTTANATAVGIRGGDGNDTITNDGDLHVMATTTGITVVVGGDASVVTPSSNHDSVFEAVATGVAGGAGNDAISNTGTDTIDVVSSATAPTVGVSLSMNGTHPAAFISTAKAESTGINGGDGDDLIMNAGGLNSTANADAAGMFGSIVPEGGGALFKADASGGVAAEASATGIAAEEGGDTITNTGDGVIQAEANATAIAGSGAIAIDGAAHAGATSRASADATGVDAGTGDDTILNQGEIDASANADASSMNIAFSQSGTADVKSAEEGGTSAEAKAVGVAGDNAASNKSSTMDLTLTPNGLILTKSGTETADGGADTLMNEATITANADARSGTKAAAVSIQGAAHGSSSSEAKAQATAIDAGAGSDTVANAPQGVLNANAMATADAVNVAFSEEGEAEAAHDAGAAAVASATGISGDGEAGDSTKETTLDIGSDGFSITRYTSKTDAGGDDILSNDGLISAGSYALSGAGAAAISIQGAAQAGTTSKSTSTATGIDAGAGADTVTNGGEIHADAGADAGALNIAFSQGGGEATQAKSSVEGGATAEAGATGIAGDGSASETSTEYNLGVTTQRLSISRLKDEHAIGGDDTITNEHVITAAATARSLAGGGAISIEGAAEAGTTSTAKAGATGIDAGLGDDTVTNSATLTAEATAEAGALNVAFSQNGEATAKHDGGAIAEAAAAGISGDGEAAQSESETSLAIGTSGLQFAQHSLKQSLGGADTLINEDMINVVSTAISGAGGVAISIEGAAQADSTSRAESKAVAIDAGAGGDNVTNKTQGTLNVAANATAAALNVSFSQKEGAKATHDGGATASASATGLTGDGAASRRTTDTTIDISTSGLHVAHQTVETAIGGDDTLTNMGAINTNANALSLTGAAAISIEGAAQAGATSTANADATGIDGGIGGDTVMNTGEVHANATADAGALNLAFSQGGSSGEGGSTNSKSSVDGGATATASATGITGDGNASDSTSETTFDVDATGLHFAHRSGSQALGGNDSLTNESTVAAAATARSGALSGAVSIEGAAQAKSTSTATSTAAAIDGAAGADVIANSGALTADANSTAIGLSVAVSPKKTATAAEGLWDGGATAEANATGISGDGNGQTRSSETMVDIGFQDPSLDAAYKSVTENPVGSDTITNSAHIDATATAVAPAVDVAISSEGMAAALSTASAKARAAAIDAGGAADEVTNHGSLDAQALANADAISVAVSGKKAAVAADTLWNGGTSAEAAATGIDADGTDARDTTSISGTINSDGFTVNLGLLQESLGGADTVINDAAINAGSIAVSAAGDVAVSAESVGGAISTSDADARATGIDAGGGGDEVTNQGALTVEADALAAAVNVAVSGKSAAIAADAVWDGGVNSEARAKGIDGDGIATNKTNETTLTIDGNGVGISHSASQTSAGGNDTISNESMIDATAVALAPSIDVAVATKGAAGAISTAHTAANAAAIDGGTGDDTITNTGQLNASADSVAAAVNVAVSGKSAAIAADAVWDGGTTAEASARGIDADGSATNSVSETSLAISGDGVTLHDGSSVANASGKDTIDNEAAVDANAVAVAPSISVPIAIKGVAVAAAASTAKAGASAIDAGNDDDTVNNSAKLTASSVANADAVNVAITTSGVAAAGGAIWGGDTTAEAISRGIDLDGSGVNSANETTLTINGTGLGFSHNESTEAASGNDMLTNTGEIDSTATAVSAGLAVGVAVEGVSTATSNSIARSRATAIDAGGGDDTIVNNKTGMLNATATSVAAAVNVAVDAGTGGAVAGNGLWDGGTTSVATAKGIDADGNATSSSNGTEIAVSGDGASLDHTESTTSASGDDTITNDATINANATVVVPSIDVAVAVSGMAVATSAFSALADAAAIDGGGGNDGIENYGKLDATAVANADAINVAVTPEGGAIAGNSIWNGGTISEAVARGIDADGSGTNTSSGTTMDFNSDGSGFSYQTSLDAASGDDTIYNDAQIDAGATAVTAGVAVGVTAEGAAAAISSSTARSYATALDAGNGNDGITNTGNGELSANATSTAVALNVGVAAGTGLAVAADAVWDGGTTAEATAKGIDGDGSASSHTSATSIAIGGDGASISHSDSTTSASGDDTINNNATIDATAVSVAPSLSAAVSVAGVGLAAATSTARTAATAIDGGGGNDEITNTGELSANATSTAVALNVSVTPAGVAVSGNNVWDGGTTSEAVAKGIDADGTGTNTSSETTLTFGGNGASFSQISNVDPAGGNDTVVNDAKIDASAVAVSPELSVAVAVEGASLALSNSTARAAVSGIDTGDGDDNITNHGTLDAGAVANADAVNVSGSNFGVNVAANAVWDGGTTAEAVATGIDADGKGKHVSKERDITLNGSGLEILDRTTRTSASGNDVINNDARINAHATAVGVSVSAAAEIPIDLLSAGVAAAISTSTAKSDATAIDGGGGNDSIINSGELDATAVSTAVTGNLTFSLIGIAASVDALWEGGTTAEATAAGIDADSGAGSITTEHRITADGTGVDFSDYTIAESLGGNDSVTNTGMITAQATAVSPSVAIGVAGILGAAGATSTATSHAVAISTGSGDDTVDNSGELTATASSTAVAVNLSAGAAGLSVNNVWDGGVKAEATTKGIDGGAGNDTIGNTASIDSEATATAPSVSIALGGIFGGAISTATTTANASAIDAGSGNDTVDNSGELTATADSTAVAVNVSESAGVALSVNNVWDGGTRSEATASGIDTGSGNDTVKNTAGTESMATATTPAVSVAFGGIVGAAVSTATSEAWASAIDTGDGNDSLTNSGQLTTTADANAVAVNVALTATGLAVAADAAWDGGTTAEAFATGIDGGKGDDALFNTASIDSTADANSTSVGVSTVLFGGVGASISTSTANSDSTAIDGGDGNDTIGNGGILTAVANSTATGVNVSLNLLGASVAADAVWDGGTTADAAAGGIDSGGGDDVIRNGNEVSAESNADSTSVGVSVTLVGVAGAASTSTAESHATAIDAGAGNDMVGNAGALTADAESDAGAVSVDANLAGIAAASDAVWDGGTTADAIAKGIDGGDGNDIVDNRAMVTANSTADASSTGVSVTVLGAAGAISAATANAQSTAIDGGAGDDAIANSGDLNADATADATGTSVSVGLVGFAGSDMSTTATATAAGVLGGGGSDVMDNSGHLDVNANATAAGTSVSVSVAGASLVDPLFDGNTSAQATAIGLGGEAGIDTITNTSNIDLTAAAQASSDGVSVGLIGFAGANAASTTMANATGIDGGEDADTLDNQGAITSTVTADSPAHAVGVNLAGASFVNASATAQAGSIGMDGGGGNDTIDNSGMITSTVTAHSPVRSVSVTLAGVASADYSSSAQADAIGIDGGQGNDVITNSGGIDLSATADAPVSGTSVGIFGVGEQDAGATASASAIGINGGDSNDQITNTNSGSVKAHATADAIVSGSSWNLAGVASQHGLASATVRATGIAGGSGMDTLVNDGSLDVDVDSTLKTQGNSSTLFGGTSADARVNGDLLATGIAGGDDGDQITNTGSATVNATSVMHADGSSLTLLGSARSSAGIDSLAQVIGIDGGSGADTITNTGTMDAETSSTATASSSSWTLAGSSGGSAGMTSESLAMGISGGDDNDAITNSVSGIIKAIAGSTTTVSGSSWTLAGKATDSGTLSALVGATGIDGGAGDDIIHNYGSVSVAGSATMTVNGGSKAIFGSAGSGSSVAASVNTTGINGNSGNDWILSTGSLSVTSSATMSSSKASFSFAGGASAGALLTATSSATGIIGGDDGDWIQNVGVLAVLAKAKQTASGGSSVSVGGSSSSSASSRAYANAVGVDLGNGADSTFNDGNITVDAEPTGTVNNSSSGGFLFGSAGTASALSLTATAHGDILGTGDNTAYNNGLGVISVTAGGSGTANANSDGGDIINGDANANANASGSGTAYGVRAESGNNTIFNYGALSVVAQPSVTANASANGNGADGDGNGTANATANGTAFGIAVGHGQNQITNNGNLTVQAKPKAVADAFADSDAGGTARATANATANANSTGILAGNGGNHIINNGTIAVSATPGGEANAHATDDAISVCIPFTSICATVEIGNKIATPHFTVSASAIGVQTGSGDDTVANYGTISTTGSNGVAISTGAGEDTVILGTNSSTTGKIDLGSDNDTLHLIGTPIVSGTIISGSGTDSLIFDGAGSFSNPLPGFAIAIKQGAGTFMIPTLSTMQRLEMNGGTLQINSNYTMSSTGVFQAQVNGDGTYGQLKSTGNVGLNGDLVVIKGPGVYVDGITYDIVSASNVSGSFASETLPAPTALVSFSTNQLPAAFQVEASVASFASVTTNSVGLSVGNALDNILPNATGDMAGLLSSFQELTKDELNNIYSGISGESYDQFRLGTMNVTQRYFGAIHSRMNLMRTAFRGLDVLEGVDRTTMAEDPLLAQFTPVSGIPGLADNRRPGERPPAYGLWVSAFGQAAKHRGGDGYSSFNDRTVGVPFGMDFTVGRNVIAGFAAGQSFSNMIHASALGRTEGAFSAVYGTYFTRNAQVETVVSHGWYKYENTRVVDLGNEKRLASSQHSGDVLSAKVEGRYLLDLDGLNVQPYVSLHFDRLAEQGFREYGAGSLDLIVKKSRTDYLTSQLGFHMVHLFSLESGKLIPEFTAAWKHDFTAGRGAITAAFSGAPDVSYRLRDNDTGNDGLQLGGALTFAGNGNFSASAGFNTELGTKRRETSALMRFQYKW